MKADALRRVLSVVTSVVLVVGLCPASALAFEGGDLQAGDIGGSSLSAQDSTDIGESSTWAPHFTEGACPDDFEQSIWVYLNETRLDLNKDFSVNGYQVCSGNDDSWTDYTGEIADATKGSYRVVLGGMGDYTGTAYAEFTVLDSTDLANARGYVDNFAEGYCPDDFDQSIRIYFDSNSEVEYLVPGTDFEVSKRLKYSETPGEWDEYTGDIADAPVGEYMYELKGIGGYHGTLEMYFSVYDPHDISYARASVHGFFSGKCPDDFEESIAVNFNYGASLTNNVDFKVAKYEQFTENDEWVAYTDPIADAPAGYYRATFEGAGDYTGTLDAEFYVNDSHDITYANVRVDNFFEGDCPDDFEQGISVDFDYGAYLTLDSDFKVTGYEKQDQETGNWTAYTNPIADAEPGTYLVNLEGVGDYEGTAYGLFSVYDPNDIQNANTYAPEFFEGDCPDDFEQRISVYFDGKDYLTLGTHYEITGYQVDSDDEGEWVAYTGAIADAELGSYRAVLEGKGGYIGTAYAYFEVKDSHDIAYANVSVTSFREGYCPDDFEQSIELTFDYENYLTQGTDFEVTGYQMKTGDDEWADYNGSIAGAPEGDYKIFLKGMGDYTGTTYGYFEVLAANDIAYASTYSLSFESGACPDDFEESFKVTFDQETFLTPGEDFIVAGYQEYSEEDDEYFDYEGDIADAPAGEYRAILEGAGGYVGTVYAGVIVYNMNDIENANVWVNDFFVGECPDDFEQSIELTYDYETYLTLGTHYEIAGYQVYSTEDEEWSAYTGAIADAPLGYYRVILEGMGDYNGTARGYFNVKDPYDLASMYGWAQSFTEGSCPSDFEEAISLTKNYQATLTLGTDYVVTGYEVYSEEDEEWSAYTGAIADAPAGKYQVLLEGKGDYHGTTYLGFTVYDPYDIENADVYVDDFFKGYCPADYEKTIEVRSVNSDLLTLGTHYEITGYQVYSEEEDEWSAYTGAIADAPVGKYMVHVEGLAPYYNSVDYRFDVIDPYDLSYAIVDLPNWYFYSGVTDAEDFVNSMEVTIADKVTLAKGTHYEIARLETRSEEEDDWTHYDGDLADAPTGFYRYILEAKEPYFGTYEKYFEVVESNHMGRATVVLNGDGKAAYTGEAIDPVVSVSLDGVELKEGVDYTVENYSSRDEIKEIGYYPISISAVDGGKYIGSIAKEFRVVKGTPVISVSDVTKTYGNAAFDLGAELTSGDGELTYASSNEKVAKVDASGKVTLVGVGTATITVSCDETDNFEAGQATAKVTVNKKANTLAVSPVKATQSATYGKATSFAANKVFKVTKNVSKGAVTYKKTSGNAKITVSSAGKLTVAKGLAAGTYTVKVNATSKATANYNAATKTVTFKVKVAQAANTLTVKAVKATQNASAKKTTTIAAKKAFKVTKNVSKGKVTYKKTSGDKKITVASDGKITVKKGLKPGKTYTVKVKATSRATKNYKAANKVITFKVKVK